jgi:diphosphomevalonate decarboxylase
MSHTSSWRSPSNIALIKYWGKYDLQLPHNPSLSFTLSACHTDMTMSVTPESSPSLTILYAGNPKPAFNEKINSFFSRIEQYFPWIKNSAIVIDSINTFPYGAGIASSASAMSAMALCLQDIDDQRNGKKERNAAWWKRVSEIARLGSGSACRSLYSSVSLWGKTDGVEASSDLFAIPWKEFTNPYYTTFEDTILVVSPSEKEISSSVGHQLMELHYYAATRYSTARENVSRLITVLQEPALINKFIAVVESEALQLHALMMSGMNPFLLLEPGTIAIIKEIWRFRKDSGLPVCFTLDAGPNVHLLYPAEHKAKVAEWIQTELVKHCSEEQVILDRVGSGPEKIS